MQIEKQLARIVDRQFVELAHQVIKRIQAIHNAGPTPLARVEIETTPEWKALHAREDDDVYGEALLWLQELLEEL